MGGLTARHRELLRKFSKHTDNDRWPMDHHHTGVPQDGALYITANTGYITANAAPFQCSGWTFLGSRHSSANAGLICQSASQTASSKTRHGPRFDFKEKKATTFRPLPP